MEFWPGATMALTNVYNLNVLYAHAGHAAANLGKNPTDRAFKLPDGRIKHFS
jgi:hypothetical protein